VAPSKQPCCSGRICRRFEINPYDLCVANKTINGKQCTVVWHVDDLKISHVDSEVVTTILDLLDAKCGQEIVGGKRAPLTINRGKIHDYLGMKLIAPNQATSNSTCEHTQRRHWPKCPRTWTAPRHHLRPITYSKLSKESKTFLCKRGQPGMQTAIAFLCTRVQQPTKHDCDKLARVFKHL
jgi:hypothetical protein